MKSWIRQHHYALRIALLRLGKQPWSSLTNVFVVALSLMLPLLGAAILSSAQPVFSQLSLNPQITLFLKHDAETSLLDGIAQRLQAEYGQRIATLRTVPREQALRNLQQNPAWSDALAALPDNPLPDAIVLTLHPAIEVDPAVQATSLAQQWQNWEAVDAVQLDSEWMQRLHSILEIVRISLGLLGLAITVVVLATVFNTVRMQALSQREEIEITRLLGATEPFVRRPFLYLGALSGLISSVVSIVATAFALVPLNTVLAQLTVTYDSGFTLQLPPAFLLLLTVVLVTALSALSARWSVTRTTRF